MPTPIQLTLTLDASGALTVTNQLGQQLQKIPPPSPKIRQEFDGIESAEKRAHIAGTLFVNLTGIELPRALENVIAKSQLIGPILSAAFDASIVLGMGAALVPLVDKISSLSDEWGGYTEAVKKVGQATLEASQQAFISPKTIQDTQRHLDQVNSEAALLEKSATLETSRGQLIATSATFEQMVVNALFAGTVNQTTSNSLHAKANALLGEQADLTQHLGDLRKQYNAQIDAENAKAATAGLQGVALLNAQYVAEQKGIFASTVGDEQTRDSLLTAAHAAYLGNIKALEREAKDQTITLQDQATEDSLQGIARVRQQEADAIAASLRDEKQKAGNDLAIHQQYAAQRIAINLRTAAQEAAINQQNETETVRMERTASDASLQGDSLILAHKKEQLADTTALYAQGLIDVQTYLRRIVAINIQANADITNSDRQTAREKANLLEQEQDANSAVALSYVAAWQKADAQALVDRDKQLRLIDQQERELLVQYATNSDMIQQITETEQARRAAVWAQTDEKIRNQHQQLVEQLGSDINSLFDDMASGNLGQRILKNAEALFAQILAQWILSLGLMKTAASSLFGNLVFGPGTTGSNVFGGSSLLGSLFGSSSTTVPASAFGLASSTGLASGSGFSATSAGVTLPGLVSGGGLAGAISGTGATSGVFSASNALTTQSLSQISGGGSVDAAVAAGGFKSQPQSLLGSLFSTKGLAAIAPLALLLAGGAGGKIGQAGGLLGGLLMSGTLSPLLSASFGTLGLAGTGALFGGAVGGLLGFGIGQNKGGLLGSLAGAGSGALTGFMVGGPIGAIAGGIIGLLGGIFGGLFGSSKRKQQANSYVDSTIVPDISQITNSFDSFQLDSNSALQQLDQLESDAQKQLATLKSQGVDIYNQRVVPAIDDAEKHVRSIETERERRAAIVFGPAQFHEGGFVDVMKANIRRQPNEMLAVLKHGEYVVNPRATAQNLGALQAINSGGNAAGSGGIHLHFHALDASTFQQWAKKGGGKEIVKALLRERQEGNF